MSSPTASFAAASSPQNIIAGSHARSPGKALFSKFSNP